MAKYEYIWIQCPLKDKVREGVNGEKRVVGREKDYEALVKILNEKSDKGYRIIKAYEPFPTFLMERIKVKEGKWKKKKK